MDYGVTQVPSYFYVGHGWSGLERWVQGWWIAECTVFLLISAVLIARVVEASPGARRRLVPLFAVFIGIDTFKDTYILVHVLNGEPLLRGLVPVRLVRPDRALGGGGGVRSGADTAGALIGVRSGRRARRGRAGAGANGAGAARWAIRRSCSVSGCPTAACGPTRTDASSISPPTTPVLSPTSATGSRCWCTTRTCSTSPVSSSPSALRPGSRWRTSASRRSCALSSRSCEIHGRGS